MILRDRTNSVGGVGARGLVRGGSVDPGQLGRLTQQMLRPARLPGLSPAVTRGGGLVSLAAFGQADVAPPVAATTTTRYLWFSMTKVVTATAALRLVDEGRLDLDAPVSEHLSWLPARSDGVPTTRQLLTHTAGLANPLPIRWVHPAADPPPDQGELVRRLVTPRDFARPAGARARYSNLGYLLAAETISAVTGLPFTEYVKIAVLGPLGMTSTGFDTSSGEMAVGY